MRTLLPVPYLLTLVGISRGVACDWATSPNTLRARDSFGVHCKGCCSASSAEPPLHSGLYAPPGAAPRAIPGTVSARALACRCTFPAHADAFPPLPAPFRHLSPRAFLPLPGRSSPHSSLAGLLTCREKGLYCACTSWQCCPPLSDEGGGSRRLIRTRNLPRVPVVVLPKPREPGRG